MKNKPYSLQLLSHGDIFETRESAQQYIAVKLLETPLKWAEPALFFYKDEEGEEPRMILAVGCSKDNEQPKYALIDNQDIITALTQVENLQELYEQLHTLVVNNIVELHGVVSDNGASKVVTTKTTGGEWVIKTDVFLSNDHSIIVSNGGLSANVDLEVDESTNTITVKIGDNEKTFSLPGINIIENIEYDSANHVIKIYIAGQTDPMIIPVADIVETWSIENPIDSPVELHRHASIDGTDDKVYATLKLRSEDNLIGVDPNNGEMYVSRETVTNIVHTEAPDYSDELDALSQRISENASDIDSLETTVTQHSTEITILRSDVDRNTSEISRVETKLDTEISTARTNEGLLSDRVTTVQNAINSEVSRATAAESVLSERITNTVTELHNLSESVDDKIDNAVTIEKTLRESSDTIITNRISALEESVTTGLASTLSDAKSYTDNKVSEATSSLTETIRETEASLQEQIAQATTDIDGELDNKIESVTVEQDQDNPLLYRIVVDGVPVGSINIPKDQFLKTATYNAASKEIELTCVTTEGETQLRIDVSDLVDTYTAGNGLTEANNVFSVRINEDSEEYLTVSEEGIKLSGINDALSTKANASEVYSRTEAEATFATIAGMNNYVTQSELNSVTDDISGLEDDLDALSDKVDIINGNEATEGSIKKALKDAKDYADTVVGQEELARENEISRLEDELASKANITDVYTSAQIDAAGYLTSEDLEPYATTSELTNAVSSLESVNNTQNARLSAIETVNTQQDTKIANLEAEATRLNLIAEDTNSIDMNVSKANTGTTVKADIRLDSTEDNIIRISGNGVYATIDLTYNSATNTLTLDNGAATKSIQLSSHTLVNSGYYDSEHKQIVLVVTTAGETSNIEIPVSDLVNTLDIDNGTNNPIILHLEPNVEGTDVLSARLNISNANTNAIINNNGTLYASKRAQDMEALWDGNAITIQKAIDNLKEKAELIDGINEDVADLADELAEVKSDLQSVEGDVTDLTQRVVTLETKVGNIETILGDYNVQLGTIADRLDVLEAFMNRDMIDFNDRNANNVDDDTIIVDGQQW